MANAITELPIPDPSVNAVTSLPIPAQPRYDEAAAYQDHAPEFAKGIRSGTVAIGGALQNLVASTGQALGYQEFADRWFEDAKATMAHAGEVGPRVKQLTDISGPVDFVDYLSGVVGQAIPQLVPATVAAVGLRRPVAGSFAAMLPQEAGDVAGRLQASGQQDFGKVLAGGGASSLVQAAIGAPALVASKLLKPTTRGTLAKELTTTAGREGVSEAGGEAIKQVADQGQITDTGALLENAVQGVIGGGALAGAGHAVGIIPSAAAKSADELRARFARKERPLDPDGMPEIDGTEPVETVAEKIGAYEDSVAKQTKDLRQTAEDTAASVYERAKKMYHDTEIAPKIKEMLLWGEATLKGATKGLKKSEAGITEDGLGDAVLENITSRYMHEDDVAGADPEDLQKMSDLVRKIVEDKGYKVEVEKGVWEHREEVPPVFYRVFGREKTADLIHDTAEILGLPDNAKALVGRLKNKLDSDTAAVKKIIRDGLVGTRYGQNPEMRAVFAERVAPILMDAIDFEGGKSKEFNAAVAEFGARRDQVLTDLEVYKKKVKLTSAKAFEGNEDNNPANSDDAVEDDRAVFDQDYVPGNDVNADKRLDGWYTAEEAVALIKDLAPGYKGARFKTGKPRADEKVQISVEHAAGDETGFAPHEWSAVRVDPRFNKSGLENGSLTVNMKRDGKDAGNRMNKVSLHSVVSAMAARDGEFPKNAGSVGRLLSRGLSLIASDPDVRSDKFPFENIKRNENGDWSLPDDTPVYRTKSKTYTWGDVKKSFDDPDMTKVRNLAANAVEGAREAASTKDIEGPVITALDKGIALARSVLEEAKADAKKPAGYLSKDQFK